MSNPEDPMTAGLTPDATTGARRWPRRRAVETPTDSVSIGDEHNHDWWAQREDLSRVVSPKRKGAGTTSRARDAAATAFAPASDETVRRPAPAEAWDLASLHAWAAAAPSDATETLDGVVAREPTPWEQLGLTPDAHWLEVVRRHRTLAKQFHPDLHSDTDAVTRRAAEVRMAEINVAFDTLLGSYGLEKSARPEAV